MLLSFLLVVWIWFRAPGPSPPPSLEGLLEPSKGSDRRLLRAAGFFLRLNTFFLGLFEGESKRIASSVQGPDFFDTPQRS